MGSGIPTPGLGRWWRVQGSDPRFDVVMSHGEIPTSHPHDLLAVLVLDGVAVKDGPGPRIRTWLTRDYEPPQILCPGRWGGVRDSNSLVPVSQTGPSATWVTPPWCTRGESNSLLLVCETRPSPIGLSCLFKLSPRSSTGPPPWPGTSALSDGSSASTRPALVPVGGIEPPPSGLKGPRLAIRLHRHCDGRATGS